MRLSRSAVPVLVAVSAVVLSPLVGCEPTCVETTEDISKADELQAELLEHLDLTADDLTNSDFPLADARFECLVAQSSADTREGEFGFSEGCGYGQLSSAFESKGRTIVWQQETGEIVSASLTDYVETTGQCGGRITYYGKSPECDSTRRYYCAPVEELSGTGGSGIGGEFSWGGAGTTGGTAATGGTSTGGRGGMGGLGGFGGAG